MSEYRSKYGLGQFVYLVTDPEQLKFMITGIKFWPGAREPVYLISHSDKQESEVYECELSDEIDVVMKTSN